MSRCAKPATARVLWPDGKQITVCDHHYKVAKTVLEALGAHVHVENPSKGATCQQILAVGPKSVQKAMLPEGTILRIKTDVESAFEALRVMLFEDPSGRIPDTVFAIGRDKQEQPLFLTLFTSNDALMLDLLMLLERHKVSEFHHHRFEHIAKETAE